MSAANTSEYVYLFGHYKREKTQDFEISPIVAGVVSTNDVSERTLARATLTTFHQRNTLP
jgi:hypothetical protein